MADVEFNSTTGRTNLYLRLHDVDTDEFWNGSSFESWLNANVGTYDVAFPEIGGGLYGTSIPAGINTARTLSIAVFDNVSPSISDEAEGEGIFDWLGTKLQLRTTGKSNMI